MSKFPKFDEAERRFRKAAQELSPALQQIAKFAPEIATGQKLRIYVRGMSLTARPDLLQAPAPLLTSSEAERLAPLLDEYYDALDAWWAEFYEINVANRGSLAAPPERYPNPIQLSQTSQSETRSGRPPGEQTKSESNDDLLYEQMLLDRMLENSKE